MMCKMPYCPRCEDEILVLNTHERWQKILCRECGWQHTFLTPLHETEMDEAIAEVVAQAQRTAGSEHR